MMILFNKIKKRLKKRRLKKFENHFEVGDNSILLDGFNLSIRFPESGKKYLKVGDDSMLSCKIVFESSEGHVTMGDRVFIGNSTIICRSDITFGNDIFVAWGTYFYDHDSHSLDYKERRKDLARQIEDYKAGRNFIASKNWEAVNSNPIKIDDDAWIGMNCIILKGVTIGKGAIVGAGSVVTHDVPDWTVVAGNPAKIIKEIPFELRKNYKI